MSSLRPSCRTLIVRALLILLFAAAPSAFSQTLRVATWNIESLGSPGSSSWNAALSVLARLDADVVAVQEVANAESSFLATFASQAGYSHHALSLISGTMSGGLKLAVLSKHPISSSTSHNSISLSGDPLANDLTRVIFEARIAVPGSSSDLGVFVVHWKSGSGGTNDFRRCVEIHRTRQAIEAFQLAHPGAPWILCGDFNEDLDDGPFGWSYNSLPSGLPSTFHLGADLPLPLVYEPFQNFVSLGAGLLDATQEDSSFLYATREASGRRLDYLIAQGSITNLGDEVYNSNRDNGIDDLPIGNWLSKSGSPLSSGTSASASDHYTVFSDLDLGSTPPPPGSDPLLPGDLVVSEYLADPGISSDTFGEWVEIRNTSGRSIDLAGCVLRDAGSDSFTFPAYTVPARGRLLVGAHTFSIINGGITPDLTWTAGSFSLDNGSDVIEIVSPAGTILDSVVYSPTQIPVLAGVSSERIDVTALPWPSNFASPTQSFGAGDLGTPGAPNENDSNPRFTAISLIGTNTAGSTNLVALSGDPGLENLPYVLAASECGTPGVVLGGTGRVIDLCPGNLLLFSITPNNGVFLNFQGMLNLAGFGSASYVVPPVAGLGGLSFQLSGVVLDPTAFEGIGSIIDNATITLQ